MFSVKHFLVDFVYQTPYMYLNKGTYLHPGGILHAFLHGWWTFWIVLALFPFPAAVGAACFDMFIHYHIDWAKVNINKKYGWKPDTSEWFWILLGLDQLLHTLTYISIFWRLGL
jgi:hypothetical protein